MTSRLIASIALLILCLSSVSVSSPAHMFASTPDWPQWRGPERNGISREGGLLKQWPREGQKLLWKVGDMGDGFPPPAFAGTSISLMTNGGMDIDFVQAL